MYLVAEAGALHKLQALRCCWCKAQPHHTRRQLVQDQHLLRCITEHRHRPVLLSAACKSNIMHQDWLMPSLLHTQGVFKGSQYIMAGVEVFMFSGET